MSLVAKNRWTASNGTILGIAMRNNGVIAAGGSGLVRLLSGIHCGVRDIDLGHVTTKVLTSTSTNGGCYKNAVDQIYLGCGANGLACLEVGYAKEAPDIVERDYSQSLLSGQYSDMYYFGSLF